MHDMNCWRVMQTGAVRTVQTCGLRLKLLIRSQQLEIFGFRVNSGVLCPRGCLEADFYSLAVTFFPDKALPSPRLTHKVPGYYATRWGAGREGSGVSDGWSIFLDKSFHKVDDFCVRTRHNTSPVCSRLATGRSCCNCHWPRKAIWKMQGAEGGSNC